MKMNLEKKRWTVSLLLVFVLSVTGDVLSQDVTAIEELKENGGIFDGKEIAVEGYVVNLSHFPLAIYPTKEPKVEEGGTLPGIIIEDQRFWGWGIDQAMRIRLYGIFKNEKGFKYGKITRVTKLEFPVELN